MEKYKLAISDIEAGVNRFLTSIYTSATISENPQVFFIIGGPGAGKSGLEAFLKYQLKEKGEKATVVSSDVIATFHPAYEDVQEELPDDRYRITREFVRPASSMIFKELQKHKINILQEKVFNKGQTDIDFVKSFKNAGYKTSMNIMATDIWVNRLACYQREAQMIEIGKTPRGISKQHHEEMYNGFIQEIQELQNLGLCDEINVYKRGKSINKPELVYRQDDKKYSSFVEAIYAERKRQREEIFQNPADYLMKITNTRDSIKTHGINPLLTDAAIKGLDDLQKEFISALENEQYK